MHKGAITKDLYISFLIQSYHIVLHTMPLILATQSRLTEEMKWLKTVIDEFTDQMVGNEGLILADIAACGGNIEEVRCSQPNMATKLMVEYAYYTVNCKNTLGILGMHHVMEGAILSLALQSADNMRNTLLLPIDAFTYLYSHGSLLQDNADVFIGAMNRIDRSEDRDLIIHSAQIFYKLYGDVLLSLGH